MIIRYWMCVKQTLLNLIAFLEVITEHMTKKKVKDNWSTVHNLWKCVMWIINFGLICHSAVAGNHVTHLIVTFINKVVVTKKRFPNYRLALSNPSHLFLMMVMCFWIQYNLPCHVCFMSNYSVISAWVCFVVQINRKSFHLSQPSQVI